MTTDINEAIAVMRGDWKDAIASKGDHCPVCDRWGKINTVTLRGIMIKTMHWIHREGNGDWVDVPARAPRFVSRSYAFSRLKHWYLVEQKYIPPVVRDEQEVRETRTSGMWRLTPIGIDFIFNGATAPDKVFIYNDRRVGASDDMVTARECINEKFNYDVMMGTTFNGDYDGLDNN